jgi:outer membrane protein, multidrug efflux system
MRGAMLAVTSMLLAGCGSVVDRADPRVDLDLPPGWTAEALNPRVVSDGEVSWSRLLGLPEVDAIVAEALARSPDMTVAAARVEQAAARARIAGADRYPQVAASVDAARRRQNFIGFPIPGSEEGAVFSTTTTTYGVGLNLSWEIDLWGRIRAGHRAGLADLDAALADLRGARLSLAAQSVKAWIALIEADQQRGLAAETLENRRSAEQRLARRYEQGLTPAIDLRLARTNVAMATSMLSQRERQRDAAARQLEILLGRYPSAMLDAGKVLPTVPDTIAAGIPADLISRRPDLVAVEQRLKASGFRAEQARAGLYPQFRLTGSAGTLTDEMSRLLDGDFSVWSFAVGILQPIFQGGRLRANVDLAEAVEDEVAGAFVRAVLIAFAEVESSIVAEASLATQEAALEDATRNAIAAQQAADERYLAGLSDYLLVLETQRQALDAESRLLEVRRQRVSALVDLILALGGDAGGDPATVVAAVEERS